MYVCKYIYMYVYKYIHLGMVVSKDELAGRQVNNISKHLHIYV